MESIDNALGKHSDLIPIDLFDKIRRDALSFYMDAPTGAPCGRGWVGTKPPGCKRAPKSGGAKTAKTPANQRKASAQKVAAKTAKTPANQRKASAQKVAAKTAKTASTDMTRQISPDSLIRKTQFGAIVEVPNEVKARMKRLADEGISVLRDPRTAKAINSPTSADNKRAEAIAKRVAENINQLSSVPTEQGLRPPLRDYRAKNSAPIKNQSDFNKALDEVMATFDKSSPDGALPIYQVRRAMGGRLSRGEFDKFLFSRQAEKGVQLYGGSVEDSSSDKINDSVYSEMMDTFRTYVKRPKT